MFSIEITCIEKINRVAPTHARFIKRRARIKRRECHANDPAALPCGAVPKFIIGERMEHN